MTRASEEGHSTIKRRAAKRSSLTGITEEGQSNSNETNSEDRRVNPGRRGRAKQSSASTKKQTVAPTSEPTEAPDSQGSAGGGPDLSSPARSLRSRKAALYTEQEEDDFTDEDPQEDGTKRTLRERTSRKRAREAGPEEDDDDEDDDDDEYEKAKSSKAKKRRNRQHETRIHTRLYPVEEEPKLLAQIKKEHKKLLKCDEPLVPNKAKGIYIQEANCNKEFEERFLEFLLFQRVYGHALVPKYFEENKYLGRWCAKVRNWRSKGKPNLTRSRKKRLDAAGFVWNAKADPNFWKVQNTCEQAKDRWEDLFTQLLEYKKENGNCLVPKEVEGKYRPLSRWVAKIRTEYRMKQRGKYNTLDDEREKRLVDAGFVFNSKMGDSVRAIFLVRYKDSWNAHYENLKKYKAKMGHCRVPRRYTKNQGLASWVMRQRTHYRKMKAGEDHYMTPERYEKLKKIDFCFVVTKNGQRAPESDEDVTSSRKTRSSKEDDGEGEADEGSDDTESIEEADEVDGKDAHDEGSIEDTAADDKTDSDEEEKANDVEPDAASDAGDAPDEDDSAEPNPDAVKSDVAMIKGRWACQTCGCDEFTCFIHFVAHESECQMLNLAPVS